MSTQMRSSYPKRRTNKPRAPKLELEATIYKFPQGEYFEVEVTGFRRRLVGLFKRIPAKDRYYDPHRNHRWGFRVKHETWIRNVLAEEVPTPVNTVQESSEGLAQALQAQKVAMDAFLRSSREAFVRGELGNPEELTL